VSARSKACVCGCSLAGIVGSNSDGDMDVFRECCVSSGRGRADHTSRGVLQSVVGLSVIVKPRLWGGPGPLGDVAPGEKYTPIPSLHFCQWCFNKHMDNCIERSHACSVPGKSMVRMCSRNFTISLSHAGRVFRQYIRIKKTA